MYVPVRHKRQNRGTVSAGTMRSEDLIPAFLRELQEQATIHKDHRKIAREIEKAMELDCYYGAHPGDGSDYGYWLSESFEDEFDGLKVNDLSEIPSSYIGEILLITDHGNMTLLSKSHNHKARVIWSIV